MVRSEPPITGARTRIAVAVAALVVCAAAAFALASSSPAHSVEQPTITGEPIVGEALTASDVGDSAFYKWQRCDPALTSCEDSSAYSSSWTDIPGAAGVGARAYTLLPDDLGFFIRVLAKRSKWSWYYKASAPVGPVTESVSSDPEPLPGAALLPRHGIRLAATAVSGTVKFKPPGQAGFSVLTGTAVIPVGSVIDTRGSKVRLTAASGLFGSETSDDSVVFWRGLFRITQPAAVDAAAVAKLVQKLDCRGRRGAGAKSSAAGPQAQAAGKRRTRKLWGRGSGRYRTRGRGGTGSVRGTTWLTKDTCKGTRFYVKEGIGITVFDFGRKKKIKLGPRKTYFASRR